MVCETGPVASEAPKPDVEVVLRLREAMLNAVELGMPPSPPEHPTVGGVVVDLGAEGPRFSTLVVLGDGTTSLCTSGKSWIGAGPLPEARTASHALLLAVEQQLDMFGPDAGTGFPPSDVTRFHVLGPTGRRTLDISAEVLRGNTSIAKEVLAIVVPTGRVITALRIASERARPRGD